MRKLNRGFKAILGTVVLVSVASVSFYTGKHSVDIPEVESLPQDVVYQDESVSVEVIKVNDEITDVYIEPLDGRNVVSNFDMDTRRNEIDAYLTVRTEENAKRLYKQIKSDFPDTETVKNWEFNWETKD